MNFHTSVLLNEVIDYLDPKPGKVFIDATVGGGGHSLALLEKGARVLAIDRDPEAIEQVEQRIKNSGSKIRESLTLVQGNFSKIGEIAHLHNFASVDGIIFDLGVSSHQFEMPTRGFSFSKDGPLDMRMDPTINIRAYDIINNFEERRLYEIFKDYGQEKHSRRIASSICSARKIKPLETTKELANLIERTIARGERREKIHPATKVFQAIRIVVNSELLNLEQALPQTVELIKTGGRLVIISFHSLEDAQVKRFFKQEKRLKILTKKPIGPQGSEIENNPRARSAKLRAAQRI